MDTLKQFRPNEACSARGKIGAGNIAIHNRKRQRYRCKICKQTFSARRGTMLEGLRDTRPYQPECLSGTKRKDIVHLW